MFYLLRSGCLSCLLILSTFSSVQGLAGISGQVIGDSLNLLQPADTLALDEILIRSTHIPEPLRYQPVDVQFIDSLQLAKNRTMPVSAVLSRYSSLFIRDNGPGSMALLSQRGLSASQTHVLWDGFPINSLSLGQADLSLMPSALFSSVEVSPGTPSSAFGGGSLGGTVYLSPAKPSAENRLEYMQSAGAYDTWNSQLNASYGDETWAVSLHGGYQTAANDYSYFNRANGRNERRLNNAGNAGHLAGSASYQLSGGRIYSSLWYWNRSGEIPGTILSGGSEAIQTEDGFRWNAGLEKSADGWNLNVRTFLERNYFSYNDPGADIDSRFVLSRWLSRVDIRRPSTGPVVWQGGVSGGVEGVDTNNYSGVHQRRLFGLRLNPEIRIAGHDLQLTPTVRLDAYHGFGWISSPSLGANWEIFSDRFHVRGMISRDFNPPSFNDLYWAPGGNPGLEPERSLKTEAGFVYLPALPFIESINITGYRIWLDEGIYWFPGAGGTWSPSNIEKVNAHGAESALNMQWRLHPAEFSWAVGADWRKSRIAAERFSGDRATGLQMRYVPEWSFRSHLSVRASPAAVDLNYRWTGQRYTTEDHSSSLPGFGIMDLSASVGRTFAGVDWQMRISVNNLLNEQYEVMQWYPMPGRHLELSLSAGFPY